MAAEMVGTVVHVLARMVAHGLVPVLEQELAEWLREEKGTWPDAVVVGDSTADVEVVVSLGGDGSILEAALAVGRAQTPILGVNLGRLGYLSNTPLEELDDALDALKKGRYTLDERSLVEVQGGGPEIGANNYALNEISVHKRDSSSMITLHAYLGERFLNTYWADGLIIATPTGSTAYSLSCGGPLLDPSCQDLAITPISPHNLTVRPLVIPDYHTIRLMVETRGDNYLVNLDARSYTLEKGTELHIRRADFTARLVQFHDQDFLITLRTKLAWGLDARSTPQPLHRNP